MFRSFAKEHWVQSQEWLIDIWLEAGRGISLSEEEKTKFNLAFEKKNPRGFCFTIDVSYVFSRYCDAIEPLQSTKFMQRLRYLNSMAYNPKQRAELIEKINADKKKRIEARAALKNKPEPSSSKLESPSTLNSKIINELEEFFHMLDFVQFHNNKDGWLNILKLNYQDRSNKLMKLISPVLLDSSGGVQIDGVLSNVGKPGFWIQGLEILKKQLDQFPKMIFQMNFSDDKHAIQVEYDATQQIWRVLDINTMPILETQNIYDVVEKLFVGFAMHKVWGEQSDLVLSFDFLRLGNQARVFQKLNQNLAKDEDWQDWRKVSATKANIVDINGNTWLCQAVNVNDDEVLPKLVEQSRHDHKSSIGTAPGIAISWNVPLFFKLAIPLAFSKSQPKGSLFENPDNIEIFLQDNLEKILNGERSSVWLGVMDLPLEIIEQIPGWDKLWKNLFLQNLLPELLGASSSSSNKAKEEEKEQTRKEECLLEMFKTISTFQNGAFLCDPQYGLSIKLNSFSDFFQNPKNKDKFSELINETKRLNRLSKRKMSEMTIQNMIGRLNDPMLEHLEKWEILITWLSVKNKDSADALRGSLPTTSPYFDFVKTWAYVSEKQIDNAHDPKRYEFFNILKKQLQEAQNKTDLLEFIKLYEPLDASLLKLQSLIKQYKNQKELPDLPLIPEAVRKNMRKDLALELEENLNDFYTLLKTPTKPDGFKNMIDALGAFILDAAEKAKQLHQAGSVASFFKIETESQFSKKLMEIHGDLLGLSKREEKQKKSSSRPDI